MKKRMITRPIRRGIQAGGLPAALFRSRGLGRTIHAIHAGRAIIAERDEKTAKLGAIFEVHADHFESGLMRTHEPDYRTHADGTEAGGNFQSGFGAHRYLNIAAEKAALEAQHADGG